jgi:hypothetical protein
MDMPRLAARFRRGSLATNAMAASVAFMTASPLPAQFAEPRQPSPEAQGNQSPLVFSPWTTFCLQAQEGSNAKLVCFTRDGRIVTDGVSVPATPTDPKTFAQQQQQQRLQQELARRAEEARRRLQRFHGEPER